MMNGTNNTLSQQTVVVLRDETVMIDTQEMEAIALIEASKKFIASAQAMRNSVVSFLQAETL